MSCDEYPVRTKQTKNNLGRELLVYAVYKCFTIILLLFTNVLAVRIKGNNNALKAASVSLA